MTAGGMPVVASLPEYRVALAELPESARATDNPRDAVVVVDGAGEWSRLARDAAAAGARAVVVAEPGEAPAGELASLSDLDAVIVVARARIRADVVADVLAAREGAAVRAVAIDGAAHAREVAAFVRDAVGWARVLAGGRLELRTARTTGRGVSALLEPSARGGTLAADEGTLAADEGTLAGPAYTVGVGVLAGEVIGGMLRIDALGEVLSEITIDPAQGAPRVVIATARGRLEAPPRYETAERLALRRAIAALHTAERPGDLADLAHDATLTASILSSIH